MATYRVTIHIEPDVHEGDEVTRRFTMSAGRPANTFHMLTLVEGMHNAAQRVIREIAKGEHE